MWITFNEEKPLNFLLSKGYVYTIRHWYPKKPQIRRIRVKGNFLSVKVKVSFIDILHPLSKLDEYVHGSGFENVKEWIDAIFRQHFKSENLRKGKLYIPKKGRLYIVKCELVN